jgi:hypothetical protein
MKILLSILAFLLFACSGENSAGGNSNNIEEDPSVITATNVNNSSSLIATVKAELYWETYDPSFNSGYDILAETSYQDNSFVLELPVTPTVHLRSINVPDDYTVSDKTAKWTNGVIINAYNKEGNEVGAFSLTGDGIVYWIYVDKDVRVKGETRGLNEEENKEYIEKFDLDLKEGWNVMYINNSIGENESINTFTTKKTANTNYYWEFKPNDMTSSSAAIIKNNVSALTFYSIKT